jgi:hypothetical protein
MKDDHRIIRYVSMMYFAKDLRSTGFTRKILCEYFAS